MFATAVLLVAIIPAADEFVIDDFEFSWTVATVEQQTLVVEKTDETIVISIRTELDGLEFSPEAGEAIGTVLKQTAAKFEAMKGKADARETIKAGEYSVSFSNTSESGFFVSIRKNAQFSFGNVLLDRKAAATFAPHLLKSKAMAAFVDKKIRP